MAIIGAEVSPRMDSSDMRKDFLVFGAPPIEEEDIQEVVACLRSGWIGTGPRVAQFEQAFREYKQAKHAIAVNSCTAALHLSLLAAGLKPADEVITTAMTFCATVNAIIHAGLTPVLADIDPITMNIDPNQVEAKITPRTRAILPVHFAGRPCDMDALCDIARRHDLKIIEDCAHAVEATYKGKPVGTFGDFGCFSFYVTKNMTTGEGGMVITSSDEAQEKVKMLALHGMTKDAWHRFKDEGYKHYQVVDCGYKYNMTDIQAALGRHQLGRLEANWQKRREIWRRYQAEFASLPVRLPADFERDTRHGLHLFTLAIDGRMGCIERDGFINAMTKNKIGVGVHYVAIPEQPYYRSRYGWVAEDYPHATMLGRQTVSIPLSATLSARDVADIVDTVSGILQQR
jgi:dTDP-4-amino-4,6-dideoxygalactose transaminase